MENPSLTRVAAAVHDEESPGGEWKHNSASVPSATAPCPYNGYSGNADAIRVLPCFKPKHKWNFLRNEIF